MLYTPERLIVLKIQCITFLSVTTVTLSDNQINIALCLGLGKTSHYKSVTDQTLANRVRASAKIQTVSAGLSGRWDKRLSKSCQQRHYAHVRLFSAQKRKKRDYRALPGQLAVYSPKIICLMMPHLFISY